MNTRVKFAVSIVLVATLLSERGFADCVPENGLNAEEGLRLGRQGESYQNMSPPDYLQALDFYKRAAVCGDAIAANQIGIMLITGQANSTDTKRNTPMLAAVYFALAGLRGYEEANANYEKVLAQYPNIVAQVQFQKDIRGVQQQVQQERLVTRQHTQIDTTGSHLLTEQQEQDIASLEQQQFVGQLGQQQVAKQQTKVSDSTQHNSTTQPNSGNSLLGWGIAVGVGCLILGCFSNSNNSDGGVDIVEKNKRIDAEKKREMDDVERLRIQQERIQNQ